LDSSSEGESEEASKDAAGEDEEGDKRTAQGQAKKRAVPAVGGMDDSKKERVPRPVLLPVQYHLFIRSDINLTGFKGVHPSGCRYQTKCQTPPCHHSHLGSFDTPEEGAQAYLQHWEKEHPEELKKERVPRPVVLPVQEHLLIRSDRSSTGFKGVVPNKGRYKAECNTSPCHHNHLGIFGTPEEAAQAYLQHQQQHKSHRTGGWKVEDMKRLAEDMKQHEAAGRGGLKRLAEEEEREVITQGGGKTKKHEQSPAQEHLLIRSDRSSTGFKGVHPNKGRYQTQCNTSPCRLNHLGTFDTPEKAAQVYLHHQQKEHPEELKKEQVPRPVLLPVQEHLLIKSDKAKTGHKGVSAQDDWYTATCHTAPCRHYHLGRFDTPEEAAQAHLQHLQQRHSHLPGIGLAWFQCGDCNTWRRSAAAASHNTSDPGEEEQWCCKNSGGLYTCEQVEEETFWPGFADRHASAPLPMITITISANSKLHSTFTNLL
jgi:hypothetical protein